MTMRMPFIIMLHIDLVLEKKNIDKSDFLNNNCSSSFPSSYQDVLGKKNLFLMEIMKKKF